VARDGRGNWWVLSKKTGHVPGQVGFSNAYFSREADNATREAEMSLLAAANSGTQFALPRARESCANARTANIAAGRQTRAHRFEVEQTRIDHQLDLDGFRRSVVVRTNWGAVAQWGVVALLVAWAAIREFWR